LSAGGDQHDRRDRQARRSRSARVRSGAGPGLTPSRCNMRGVQQRLVADFKGWLRAGDERASIERSYRRAAPQPTVRTDGLAESLRTLVLQLAQREHRLLDGHGSLVGMKPRRAKFNSSNPWTSYWPWRRSHTSGSRAPNCPHCWFIECSSRSYATQRRRSARPLVRHRTSRATRTHPPPFRTGFVGPLHAQRTRPDV
jgi:hypothetical protein